MGNIHQSKRVVIKIGSSSLTHPNGLINIRAMEALVKVLSDIVNSGREIIIVTSGAVAVGMGVMGIDKRPDDIPSRQAVAAVGQCELMSLYQDIFGKHHHIVSQILLSRDVTDNAQFTQNVRNTFDKLLEKNVIPIVNENDSICVDELAYGDNDTLSAIVAVISDSDSLVLLTDTDGLYTANPKKTNRPPYSAG
jgi:glutamate 5-kinase